MLQQVDTILNDELSIARDEFRNSVAAKVTSLAATGNRFSTALLRELEELAIVEIRRRATVILDCWDRAPLSTRKTVQLDQQLSWAQAHLNQEAADISSAVTSVSMGSLARRSDFLNPVIRSSTERLAAELTSRHQAVLDQEVTAEPPEFIKHAKWFATRGLHNRLWIVAGLALLILSTTIATVWKKMTDGSVATPTPAVSPVAVGDLRLVDASAQQDKLDVKVVNRGAGVAFVKELRLQVDEARVGGTSCGPIRPTADYGIIVTAENAKQALKPTESLAIKLSQAVASGDVDRFTISFRLAEGFWAPCADYWLFTLKGTLLYDQDGQVDIPSFEIGPVMPETPSPSK